MVVARVHNLKKILALTTIDIPLTACLGSLVTTKHEARKPALTPSQLALDA